MYQKRRALTLPVKWSLSLIFAYSYLFSAGPVLHLWVAERFCEINGINSPEALQELMVGTEFPDIRYIAQMPRELTHLPISDIKEVYQSETYFDMGMRLHAWVDVARENFIRQEVYQAALPYAESFSAAFLKFIEEEILADLYDGRQWSHHFNTSLPQELDFTQEEIIAKWHEMVQWTLAARPSWLLWCQSYKGPAFGIPVETLYNWSYLLPSLKQEPLFRNHLESLLEYLVAELQKSFQSRVYTIPKK